MNCKHRITIFAALMSTCFAVSAEEVFEKVDKQGGMEFSDQPSPDAKVIDVNPNVVNVTPVKPMETTPSATPAGVAKMPADSSPPEVIREGGGTGYLREEDERRKEHRKREQKMQHKGEAVQQPVRKQLGNGAGQAR